MDYRYMVDDGYFFTGEFDYAPVERVPENEIGRYKFIDKRKFWEKNDGVTEQQEG